MDRPSFLLGVLVSILAVAALALVLSGEVSARTIVVDQNGNGDTESIPAALHNAQDGDVVEVWEGRYDVNATLFINTSLSLRGNGTGLTILNGSGELGMNLLQLNLGNVSVEGFTMLAEDGYISTGIFVAAGVDDVLIRDCELVNPYIQGIKFEYGPEGSVHRNVTVEGCTVFVKPDAHRKGWGLVGNLSGSSISDCLFQNNSFGLVIGGEDILVQNCRFVHCKEGVELEDTRDVTVKGSTFLGCHTGLGGEQKRTKLEDNIFIDTDLHYEWQKEEEEKEFPIFWVISIPLWIIAGYYRLYTSPANKEKRRRATRRRWLESQGLEVTEEALRVGAKPVEKEAGEKKDEN